MEVATYGDNGSVSILKDIAQGGGMVNRFYGAPTKVMSEKMAALHTKEDEMIIRIIMGEPLESFDAFVEEWYKLGGEEITKEVNDWWGIRSERSRGCNEICNEIKESSAAKT